MRETARCLKTRISEHGRPSSKNSAVLAHIKKTGHQFDWQNTKILDRSDEWLERGMREAMQIYIHPASLNRDSGRYDLPTTYYKLLHKPGENPVQGPRRPIRDAKIEDDEDEPPTPSQPTPVDDVTLVVTSST